ncbi:MAG TPA: transposase [Chitinophagaceae bacterium]|nr:transposase [Chitinophagaceae bacterium]HQV06889.1 transposase [Chitinophagaceae bacterium]
MERRSRRKFSPEFKTKVVLEALKERSTIEELARKYELHPTQITLWRKEAISKLSLVFGKTADSSKEDKEEQMDKLYSQIGQLKVENDFLKKRLF